MTSHAVPAARAINVVKTYGAGDTQVRALDGVSVGIRRGELTAIAAWCGRSRRTTRLITTAAACAANVPAPATSQLRRRCGWSRAPSAATASQPKLCSPKCDIARATGSTPERPWWRS